MGMAVVSDVMMMSHALAAILGPRGLHAKRQFRCRTVTSPIIHVFMTKLFAVRGIISYEMRRGYEVVFGDAVMKE
jgi:hypothetical protein